MNQKAIITFESKISCQLAIKSVNGLSIGKNTLKVTLIKPWTQPPHIKKVTEENKITYTEKTNEEKDKTLAVLDPNLHPCIYFIHENCKNGDNCNRSHTNCLEMKKCKCCKYDTTSECTGE